MAEAMPWVISASTTVPIGLRFVLSVLGLPCQSLELCRQDVCSLDTASGLIMDIANVLKILRHGLVMLILSHSCPELLSE